MTARAWQGGETRTPRRIPTRCQPTCGVCRKPSPRRTPEQGIARYHRLRQLEAEVLTRRARHLGLVLRARIGGSYYDFTPGELIDSMRRRTSHWRRSFWQLVEPRHSLRRALRGTE